MDSTGVRRGGGASAVWGEPFRRQRDPSALPGTPRDRYVQAGKAFGMTVRGTYHPVHDCRSLSRSVIPNVLLRPCRRCHERARARRRDLSSCCIVDDSKFRPFWRMHPRSGVANDAPMLPPSATPPQTPPKKPPTACWISVVRIATVSQRALRAHVYDEDSHWRNQIYAAETTTQCNSMDDGSSNAGRFVRQHAGAGGSACAGGAAGHSFGCDEGKSQVAEQGKLLHNESMRRTDGRAGDVLG